MPRRTEQLPPFSLPISRLVRSSASVCLLVLVLMGAGCSADDESTAPSDAASGSDDTSSNTPNDVGAADTSALDSSEESETSSPNDASGSDTGDATTTDTGGDIGPTVLAAADYCEAAVDVFCPYYVRCERMVAADLDECRTNFLQSCNSRYEPIYAGLADRGLLQLTQQGLDTCAAHLETVPCEAQLQDLDGGCGDVWTGLSPSGSACGPGIESFVCAPGTTCVLGLDFCGVCQPAGAIGEPCVDNRCVPEGSCVADTCVQRPTGGEACDGFVPCRLGSSCIDGVCQGRAWAKPGEACGQVAQCQYKSACIGGVCVEGALESEACGGNITCAAGWCDGETCQPRLVQGAVCSVDAQCLTGNCNVTCGALQTMCLQ